MTTSDASPATRAELPILEHPKAQIMVIQLQIRLLHQFDAIELHRYEHASRLITESAARCQLRRRRRFPTSPFKIGRAHV